MPCTVTNTQCCSLCPCLPRRPCRHGQRYDHFLALPSNKDTFPRVACPEPTCAAAARLPHPRRHRRNGPLGAKASAIRVRHLCRFRAVKNRGGVSPFCRRRSTLRQNKIAVQSGARLIMERFPYIPGSGTLICDMAICGWLGTEIAGHKLAEPVFGKPTLCDAPIPSCYNGGLRQEPKRHRSARERVTVNA